MRIVIDARAYGWAGVGRYTRNLLKGLAEIDSRNEYVVLIGDQSAKKEVERLGEIGQFKGKMVEPSYYSWREQTVFLGQLWSTPADLYHFTHFNVPRFFYRPYVVTIHDVTRFHFTGQREQSLGKQVIYENVFAHAVRRARGIITVSDTTSRDLERLPLFAPSLITCIYEGVDADFLVPVSSEDRQRARMMIGSLEPYLLYVGVWMGHKNLPRLLATYTMLRKKHPRLKLVLTGKPKPGYVNVDKIAQGLGLGTDQVLDLDFVSHQNLRGLYAEAECLLFPSLYEGFGLPALEAMACGTPVVASNVSSFPEVLQDAAVLVNPEYIPGMVSAVDSLLVDQKWRHEMIRRGKRRAGQFSWRRCAKETLEVYEAVSSK